MDNNDMTGSDMPLALDAFGKALPELSRLASQIRGFNVFDALKLARAEIRHSNFLAWLLDPTESHELGAEFLMPFVLEWTKKANILHLRGTTQDLHDYRSLCAPRHWITCFFGMGSNGVTQGSTYQQIAQG